MERELYCKIVLTTFFFFFCSIISGRDSLHLNLAIDRFNIENSSLSQTAISSLYQDEKYGFLWVGNQVGIERFDGVDFKLLKEVGRVRSIVGNSDYLLIGSRKGLFKMSLSNFKTDTIKFSTDTTDFDVRGLYLDRGSNTVWIGTTENLYKYDIEERSIKAVGEKKFSRIRAIEKLDEDIFFGSEEGLYKLNSEGNTVQVIDATVWSIVKKNNVLYVGTVKEGIFKISHSKLGEVNSEEFISFTNDKNITVTSMLFEEEKYLWVGTRHNGVFRFDLPYEKHIEPKELKEKLGDNGILSMYQSKDGIIWIGTNRDGLNYNANFRKFFDHHLKEGSVNDNNVWALHEQKNNSRFIWVGTERNGLIRYDLDNESAEIYDTTNSYKNIYTILDVDSFLILGTDDGLWKFDIEERKCTRILEETFKDESILSLYYEKEEKQLWVGTIKKGLYKSSYSNHVFSSAQELNLKHSLKDDSSKFKPRVIYINKIKKNIWVGTETGLRKYALKGNTPISFEFEAELENKYVSCIIPELDDKGMEIYWVSVRSEGLMKFSYEQGRPKTYETKDGLTDSYIYGLIQDSSFIWLSTNSGIFRFDKKSEKFKLYRPENGLQSKEFNSGAYYKSQDGSRIFFGGINGFNSFRKDTATNNQNDNLELSVFVSHLPDHNPSKLDHDPSKLDHVCTVKLSDIYKEDGTLKPFREKKIYDSKMNVSGIKLFLNHFLREEFPFHLIVVKSGENLIFSSFVESYIEKKDHLNNPIILNPEKREYTISIFDQKNEELINIQIKFDIDFFDSLRDQQLLIFLIFPLIMLLIMSLLVHFRSIKKNAELERDRALFANKSKNYAMRSHFTKNVLCDLHSFIYDENASKEEAESFFSAFSILYEETSHFAESEKISLRTEIEYLEQYMNFEKSRRAFKFEYEFNIDVSSIDLFIPPLMIQTFIENALQHGFPQKTGKKNILIQFLEQDKFIKCTIIDNGIGIMEKNPDSPVGKGIRLTRERLRLLEKRENTRLKLRIENNDNSSSISKGTKVTIELPVIN